MLYHLILFAFLGLTNGNVDTHPIHISRTEINVASKDKEIQISARIYIDDLELALKQANKKPIKLFVANEAKDVDKVVAAYISSKLKIQVDGKVLAFEMIGREQSEDFLAVWCYLQAPIQKIPTSIVVDNHILHDIYDDQKNMVEITIDGKRKNSFISEILDKPKAIQL